MLKQWLDWLLRYPELKYVLQIAGLILLAWLVRRFVMGWLHRWAAKTETRLDDALVRILSRALAPLLIIGVITASLNLFPLSDKLLAVLNRILYLGALLVALWFASQVVQLLVGYWIQKRGGEAALMDPARFIARVAFAGIAVMLLLENLGVSLTAVWTTLGVGSVAVALALQDTLSNFFAGVYLRLDRPIRVGDFVRLETEQEGYVIEQGWRSTQIRTLPNAVVVVPNARLASSTVINYSLPTQDMSLAVPISVNYESDPERIERILLEETAQATGKVPGLLAEPAPFVRLIPGFGESSLDFTLVCRVATFVDQYPVQHELRKRILARFRAEGIEIPFPQRTVHVRRGDEFEERDTEADG